MPDILYTTAQAARILALHEGHIRRLAIRHGIGTKLSERVRVFSESDIERLRQRNQTIGRPPTLRGTQDTSSRLSPDGK
jgi:hypothetical protein